MAGEKRDSGPYLEGIRGQPPKCSAQKFSTLLQQSAVAVVNIPIKGQRHIERTLQETCVKKRHSIFELKMSHVSR